MAEILIGTKEDVSLIGDLLLQFNIDNIILSFDRINRKPYERLCYVVKEGETLLAGIFGQVVMGHALYVDSLFVSEAHRHKGYATTLLYNLEEAARLKGCSMAWLDSINEEAIKLYKSRGYELFSSVEGIPAPGVTMVSMKKRL